MRSRYPRGRKVRRVRELYHNPFPIQERVKHYFRHTQRIDLDLSGGIFCQFGKGFSVNNPGDPIRNDGSAALNVQALGFDRYADLYRTFYVPSATLTFHFRRALNKTPESFTGFVGYIYSDGVGDTATLEQNDELTEITMLKGHYNQNTGTTLALGDSLTQFFRYPRLVYRRFGISDGEHGTKVTFNFQRDKFLKVTAGLGQSIRFENAVGNLDGGTLTSPTENAWVVPFIAVQKPNVIGVTAGTEYTETAPGMYCETTLWYNTVWRDLRGTNDSNGLADVDVRADASTYNENVAV